MKIRILFILPFKILFIYPPRKQFYKRKEVRKRLEIRKLPEEPTADLALHFKR
jgi:hypothetical protein